MTAIDVVWLFRHWHAVHITANAFRFVQALYGTLNDMLRAYERTDC